VVISVSSEINLTRTVGQK